MTTIIIQYLYYKKKTGALYLQWTLHKNMNIKNFLDLNVVNKPILSEN